MICHQYGLNPLMKHLFLIPFKRKEKGVVVGEDWVTVLGIKSNRLIAQRRHYYSYLDLTPRIMTNEEQEKILGEFDDLRVWAITKLKDMGTGAEVMGVGSWPKDEVPHGADKGNTKLNMACIRSERQALDRQYPGEMPQGVAVMDEEFIGEITEGEAVTLLDEKEPRAKGVKSSKKVAHNVDQSSSKASAGEERLDAETRKRMEQALEKEKANFTEQEQSSEKSDVPAAEVVGEGFNIDLQWLKDSLSEIKWSDNTCKSFLVSQFKVSPDGSLEDVISRLTRVQAEEFLEDIKSRLEKQQATLF